MQRFPKEKEEPFVHIDTENGGFQFHFYLQCINPQVEKINKGEVLIIVQICHSAF